jgi:SAM-dependent methyltransferase
MFELLLASLPIQPEEFTFVDFGAGKGRALLLAAERPFRRVVGVEFSAQLAEIARHNLERYIGPLQCSDVDVVVADAVDFELPDGPVVAFFFNPFGESVMRVVAGNLARSVARSPRPVWVILTGAGAHAPVFEEAGFARVEVGFPGEGRTRGIFASPQARASESPT